MEDGSGQNFPHPSPSAPRVDRHSLSLAQPQGWTRTAETPLPCPSRPTEAVREVAGLTTSTPPGPLTPRKGLSVEEAGGVPDRVLTASRLDTPAPWGLVQQTLRGGLWVPEMLLGIPQAVAETHVSRLHRATVSGGGWLGKGAEPRTEWSEAGHQCLQPEPGHSTGQAAAGFRCRSREMGQRMKRPHHQRHCRQCGQTRCPGGLAPKDASPAASLGKTRQPNSAWLLPTSPAQPRPRGGRGCRLGPQGSSAQSESGVADCRGQRQGQLGTQGFPLELAGLVWVKRRLSSLGEGMQVAEQR